MTYTIYGDLRSGVFSSEAALAEAGAPYTFELISIEKNAQKTPEFLAINPSGKIPALKTPDGQIVTESLAILLTVADRFPAAKLLPETGSAARADVYRWLAFMAGGKLPHGENASFSSLVAAGGA